MECVSPGAEVFREVPSRPQLFRSWIQRNSGYVGNYNPPALLSFLDNADIQGWGAKYGVFSYVALYITHRWPDGGSPLCRPEICITGAYRARQRGRKSSGWPSPDSLMRKWRPELLAIRKYGLRIGTYREIPARDRSGLWRCELRQPRANAGRGGRRVAPGGAYFTTMTELRWYESRFAAAAAVVPTVPHPWAPEGSWLVGSRGHGSTYVSFLNGGARLVAKTGGTHGATHQPRSESPRA